MQLTIELDKLPVSLDELAKRALNIEPVMAAGEFTAVSDVKSRFDMGAGPDGTPWVPLGWPRPQGGMKPLRNFGLMAGSITGQHTPTTIIVGTAHPGRNVHQFGATITPKRGKYLAIPVTTEAARSGGPRRFSRELKFQFVRGVGAALVDKETGLPQFRLIRKSVIPARPFMGWSKQWVDDFTETLLWFITTGRL